MLGLGSESDSGSVRLQAIAVRQQINAAVARLRSAGIDFPEQEAEVLAVHAQALPAADEPAAEEFAVERYAALIDQRCQRVPLEHLTGKARFRTLDLLVGPGVFVPQPETSSVVDWAVDALHALIAKGEPHPLCVDLCTGSGTIALSLAAEVPAARVHAVEIDPGALAWAAKNAEHHRLAVTLHGSDIEGVLTDLEGRFDLVTSNPPYVATDELAQVRPEVRDYDPSIALGAGPDGLDVIRAVERTARRLLRPGGRVIVEHSDRQGSSAPAVFSAAEVWSRIEGHRDHEGLDRFVTATRV